MAGRKWRGWAVGVAAAALGLTVPGGLGGLVGLAGAGEGSTNQTITTSSRTVTTTQRVDLEAAPAPECDFPGSAPVLVDESSQELPDVVTLRETIGPASILIGDLDAGGTPFEVPAGTSNLDILTEYHVLVTRYFQATAAGEACAVVAAVTGFTG